MDVSTAISAVIQLLDCIIRICIRLVEDAKDVPSYLQLIQYLDPSLPQYKDFDILLCAVTENKDLADWHKEWYFFHQYDTLKPPDVAAAVLFYLLPRVSGNAIHFKRVLKEQADVATLLSVPLSASFWGAF